MNEGKTRKSPMKALFRSGMLLNTIRNRFLGVILITGFVPLAVLYFLSDSMIGSAVRKNEQEKIVKINQALASHISALMKGDAQDLGSIQTNRFLSNPDEKKDERVREMRRLVGVYDSFTDISLYDSDGYLICSTTESHPDYREYTIWFKGALKGQTSISRPQREIGKKGLHLSVYLPVFGVSGVVQNVIRARMDFTRVADLVELVRPGNRGYVVLLDELGNRLTGAYDGTLLEKFGDGRVLNQWQKEPVGVFSLAEEHEFLYSAQILAKAQTQVGASWVLLAMVPMSEVNATLDNAQNILLLATLGTLLLGLIVSLLVSNHLSKPIVKLREVASHVASGNLDARAAVAGANELRDLANSFNLMVNDLREHREGLEGLVESRTKSLLLSQAELERTGARLHAALDSFHNGFVAEDEDGRLVLVNQTFLDLHGLERFDVEGRQGVEVFRSLLERSVNPGDADSVLSPAKDPEATIDHEFEMRQPLHQVIHLYSAPILDGKERVAGRVWTTRDMTEQRELELSLRQAQKMEALGQLAGGVAHDFNNLLTGILGNLALMDLELAGNAEPAAFENLRSATKAGERAAELVKNLLGFSRRSHLDLKQTDANAILREIRNLLVVSTDPSISLELELNADLWGLMADPNLLSQVIMNMGVNARDALAGGGTLKFSSSNRVISADEAGRIADARTGDFICLTVEDDGEGMSETVQKKIFEPFFTTKDQGKGTGLGLATSFGIVKQLGGWITFESTLGVGTRFDVFLPRSAAAENQVPVTEEPKKAGCTEGTETLLLVDDEPGVRGVAEALLKRQGYRILVASNGREALEIYESERGEVDLIMLDLTMPVLSGRETFAEIRKRDANVPVLICSGYLVDLNAFEEETGYCPDGFVQKPYRIDLMAETVRGVLDCVGAAA